VFKNILHLKMCQYIIPKTGEKCKAKGTAKYCKKHEDAGNEVKTCSFVGKTSKIKCADTAEENCTACKKHKRYIVTAVTSVDDSDDDSNMTVKQIKDQMMALAKAPAKAKAAAKAPAKGSPAKAAAKGSPKKKCMTDDSTGTTICVESTNAKPVGTKTSAAKPAVSVCKDIVKKSEAKADEKAKKAVEKAKKAEEAKKVKEAKAKLAASKKVLREEISVQKKALKELEKNVEKTKKALKLSEDKFSKLI
jgi:hypothetical protein